MPLVLTERKELSRLILFNNIKHVELSGIFQPLTWHDRLYMIHCTILFCRSVVTIFYGGGTGGNFLLRVPTPFHSGFHLCMLFPFQNIAQCCKKFSYFSRLSPPLLAPPIDFLHPQLLPGSFPHCPPPLHNQFCTVCH